MKKQEDQHRSEREFAVGDWVFLKLQPYVQTSLAPRANQKLAFKYFGPFKVLDIVGKVAYKLQLPDSSSIHPVFHVSQLKQAMTDQTEVVPSLPSDICSPHVPEKILQHKFITKGIEQSRQVLVKWTGWPLELSTWENETALKQMYPSVPAWGQAASQGRGNVTTASEEQLQAQDPVTEKRPRKANPRMIGPEWTT
jgi:hypothetical protein